MNTQAKSQLLQVLGLVLLVTLTGAIIGYPFLFLSIFLLLYVVRLLLHLGRLDDYIVSNEEKPMMLMGILDAIYSRIYTLRRKSAIELQDLNELLIRNENWLNQLRDAVLVIDEYDHIIRLNIRCQQLFNINKNQSIDFSVYSLIRQPVFTEYLNKRNYDTALELKLNTIPARWLEIRITAYSQERLLLLRDITEQQLTNQVKQDFIANLSHELRTPMTVLKGYTEMLPVLANTDSKEMTSVIEGMQGQVNHLTQLVEDLSDLVIIESTAVRHHSGVIDVGTLIKQQVEACKMLDVYQQQTIDVEIDEPLSMKGNPKEITSVISNLISNAIKYTQADQSITVRWYKQKHQLIFSVEDTGVGIEASHISRLTERFYRVENSRIKIGATGNETSSSGTGLGLAIVKHALINHRATLNITSQPEKGSTFRCLFPETLAVNS